MRHERGRASPCGLQTHQERAYNLAVRPECWLARKRPLLPLLANAKQGFLSPHGDDSGCTHGSRCAPLALCTSYNIGSPPFPLSLSAPRVFRRQEQAFTYADALEARLAPDDAARYKVLSFETNSTGSRLASPCPPRSLYSSAPYHMPCPDGIRAPCALEISSVFSRSVSALRNCCVR